VFSEWLEGINNRLDGQRLPVFWGSLALIVLVYLPLSRLARRILARSPTSRFPQPL
jgi:potassium efflux system protein